MKVLLASFEPRRDTDSSRSTLRSKANPTHEQQAVLEPADQDAGRYEHTLNAHDSIHQAVLDLLASVVLKSWMLSRESFGSSPARTSLPEMQPRSVLTFGPRSSGPACPTIGP